MHSIIHFSKRSAIRSVDDNIEGTEIYISGYKGIHGAGAAFMVKKTNRILKKKKIKLSTNCSYNRRNFIANQHEIELTKIVKIDQNCRNSEIMIFIDLSETISGEYYDKRQAAKQTWVSEAIKFNIPVSYVIGESLSHLELEAFRHKDIIQFLRFIL
jgi:hypothetical protein